MYVWPKGDQIVSLFVSLLFIRILTRLGCSFSFTGDLRGMESESSEAPSSCPVNYLAFPLPLAKLDPSLSSPKVPVFSVDGLGICSCEDRESLPLNLGWDY